MLIVNEPVMPTVMSGARKRRRVKVSAAVKVNEPVGTPATTLLPSCPKNELPIACAIGRLAIVPSERLTVHLQVLQPPGPRCQG